MRVAVFTDNDFDKVNGVADDGAEGGARRAPRPTSCPVSTRRRPSVSISRTTWPSQRAGVPIPFYGEMKVYWPLLA